MCAYNCRTREYLRYVNDNSERLFKENSDTQSCLAEKGMIHLIQMCQMHFYETMLKSVQKRVLIKHYYITA